MLADKQVLYRFDRDNSTTFKFDPRFALVLIGFSKYNFLFFISIVSRWFGKHLGSKIFGSSNILINYEKERF